MDLPEGNEAGLGPLKGLFHRGRRRCPLCLLPYFDILWYNIHKKLIYGPPRGEQRWFGASKGVIS